MEYYELNFFGLSRKLPITYLSATKRVANFSIIGDIEFTEKAGEELEKVLRQRQLIPDCFVGPGISAASFVHHLAKRFGHKRYVILRKSIRGYMVTPEIQSPWRSAPKHTKKLVLNGFDREFLKGKTVVLVDTVVSTGVTMEMLHELVSKIGSKPIAKCAIFLQGDDYKADLMYLAKLPIIEVNKVK